MFFDEELEKIVEENKNNSIYETIKAILICWKNRLPNPENMTVQDFINEVRKMESGWQLFCKRHQEFKADSFKDFILNGVEDEDKKKEFKKAFHW